MQSDAANLSLLAPPGANSRPLIVETLAIGDELLRGETLDSNASYLASSLLRAGVRLAASQVLPDDTDMIVAHLRAARGRVDVLVVSGGLGPTVDDRTAESAALALDAPLQLHVPTLERIRALFASRGYTLTPNNEKQALVPTGALVLENPVGTAPAFTLRCKGTGGQDTDFYFLPGVPREYHAIVDGSLLPLVRDMRPGSVARAHTLHTIGSTESGVDQRLRGVNLEGVRLSTRVETSETHVILVAEGTDAHEVETRLARVADRVHEALGRLVYGTEGATLASTLGDALVARGWTLAIAESCTGGLIAGEVTGVAGSSRYFKTGIVAYANETKIALLGVPEELLTAHGAVSEAVARAMARGVRERTGADVGLAVTGVAGPGGATQDKPVGLVHFAAVGAREVHRRIVLPGGRQRVRQFAARIALAVALESLLPEAGLPEAVLPEAVEAAGPQSSRAEKGRP